MACIGYKSILGELGTLKDTRLAQAQKAAAASRILDVVTVAEIPSFIDSDRYPKNHHACRISAIQALSCDFSTGTTSGRNKRIK